MIQRYFTIGSEWLYLKLYSGPKTIENILITKIRPVLEFLLKEQYIDLFFFIRYMDPEYHIRLRIHFNDISHIGFIISCLMKELGEYVNNNVISNIVVDTYKREIERYRERYIQDVERLFYIDSKYIINFLSNEENEVDKWLVSVKYIDLLLDMCDFKLNDKIDFCTRIKSAFAEEIYSNDKYIRKQLNQKYRDNTKLLRSILSDDSCDKYSWARLLQDELRHVDNFIQKIKKDDYFEKIDILSSIIHMHINRLFRTKQRVIECVLYHFLSKYYESYKSLLKYNEQQ